MYVIILYPNIALVVFVKKMERETYFEEEASTETIFFRSLRLA